MKECFQVWGFVLWFSGLFGFLGTKYNRTTDLLDILHDQLHTFYFKNYFSTGTLFTPIRTVNRQFATVTYCLKSVFLINKKF